MPEKCELIPVCGFFKNYLKNCEVIQQGWIKNICENKEKSEKCKRKIYRQAMGKPPVDNMTPTGTLL